MNRMAVNRESGVAQAAEATLKYHGRSFHLASRLLPWKSRIDAARLYAFCRYVDDLADETEDQNEAMDRLCELRQDLARRRSRSTQSADFLALAEKIDMSITPALNLIDTVAAEVQGIRISDESDLIRYAYGVAGTVGLMMCTVLGARMPKASPFAVDLGIAMQLTNIARDVGEDAAIGRVYLPESWLGRLCTERILAPSSAEKQQIQQATAQCLRLADHYYERGLAGLPYLPARPRVAIRVAADVYRAIGTRVAAADYRSWDQRAVVPVRTRLLIAAGSVLGQLVGSVSIRGRSIHEAAMAAPGRPRRDSSGSNSAACKAPPNSIS